MTASAHVIDLSTFWQHFKQIYRYETQSLTLIDTTVNEILTLSTESVKFVDTFRKTEIGSCQGSTNR